MTVLIYLAVGALFAFAASVSLDRGGAPLLAVTTLVATVALLTRALLKIGEAAESGSAFGFPVLAAVVPPLVTAGVIHWVGRTYSSRWTQWLVGMLVWVVMLAPIGLVALLLG